VNNTHWTKAEIQWLQEYYLLLPLSGMLLGLPHRTGKAIHRKAQLLGLSKPKELFAGNLGAKKYDINEAFFDEWTHDSAYVYGYFLADGYMRRQSGSWCIGFSAHVKDRQLLENVRTVMASTHPLHPSGNVLRLIIGNKNLYRKLEIIGARPRKSLALTFPSIPLEYLPSFVRGFFDGDGCATYQRSGKYKYPYISMVANESFIRCLHDALLWVGINGRIYSHQREGRKQQWLLRIHRKKDLARFCEWVYSVPGPFMTRKRDVLYGGRKPVE